MSAHTGEGLDILAHKVSDALSHAFADVDIEMNVDNGRLMAYLAANGEILSRSYHDQRVTLHCRLPQKFLGRIHDATVEVRDHRSSDVTPTEDDGAGDSAVEDVA